MDNHWGGAKVDTLAAYAARGWLDDSRIRNGAINHTQTFEYFCEEPVALTGELWCDDRCRVF